MEKGTKLNRLALKLTGTVEVKDQSGKPRKYQKKQHSCFQTATFSDRRRNISPQAWSAVESLSHGEELSLQFQQMWMRSSSEEKLELGRGSAVILNTPLNLESLNLRPHSLLSYSILNL